jgi:HSP20 family protein
MEADRMKQWLDLAKQFHQGQFWDGVFEADYAKQIMDQFAAPSSKKTPDTIFPRADVLKSAREIIILIDLPGIRKEDVELSIMDGSLSIKGVSNAFHPDLQVIQTERFKGEFERAIPLPEKIGPGIKISAKFDNGLLEIRLPRSQRPKENIRIE